jgi:O-acetyl-ADP-ribose deacetylase (regulator of RNase III)
MARAWTSIAACRPGIEVHHGTILEVPADAVVSPANSHGLMRGGIDAVYAQTWPGIEARVRSAILALHGGELPVGEAVVVPTGGVRPAWLISAPTMREPTEKLPEGTVHPYLAARAVFRLWRDGRVEDGRPVRRVLGVLALPGLGTGVGGVDPEDCARQLAVAWDETFDRSGQSASA